MKAKRPRADFQTLLPAPLARRFSLDPKRAKIILLAAGVSLLTFSAVVINRPLTSDDVAQQAYTHDLVQGGPHHIMQENDTFILKLPTYLLLNSLTTPGRLQIILEAGMFSVLMIVLLAVWWRRSAPHTPSSLLIFIWLLSAGVYWLPQAINPNSRNVELPLMLIFGSLLIDNIAKPTLRRKTTVIYFTCVSLLIGLLMYNDPYFLFVGLLPLALTILWRFRRDATAAVLPFATFLLGLSVYALLSTLFRHLGLTIGAVNEVNALVNTFTPLHELPKKTLQVLGGYLSLLGAEPSSGQSGYPLNVSIVLNGSIIGLALMALYHIVSRRDLTPVRIWMLATTCVVVLYLVVSGESVRTRYLLILLPLTALGAAATMMNLRTANRKCYLLALIVVGFSLVFNISYSADIVYRRWHTADPNRLDYQLIAALSKQHITKTYADYWLANITYYLSDYKDNVLPTSCGRSRIYGYPSLVDMQRFETPSQVTGIVVDPQLVMPAPLKHYADKGCTSAATIAQFGQPERTIVVEPGVTILVYRGNPWARPIANEAGPGY